MKCKITITPTEEDPAPLRPAQGLSTSLLAFCLYVCFLLFDGGSLALRGVELELMGNLEEF